MSYKAPLKEFEFLLRDVFNIDRLADAPAFAEAGSETSLAILEEGAKFVEGVIAPLNRIGDQQGCVLHPDHSVTTPEGFKEAYKQYCEAGWPTLSAPAAYGGQELPTYLNIAFTEMVAAANVAWGMYPGLSQAAIAAINEGASDELKNLYLPKMATGEWTGAMNLTEPHCGTDLGLLRTKARKEADGSYRITGQKIWISAGEHDFADNIVHLVLARIEGAPAGTKGVSLFVVPKFLPDAAGNPGIRNTVTCAGLEHKMGIHGNATCVMAYDDAKGWLVGEENSGLKIMFIMMNHARIGTGLQGVALGAAALQAAEAFAKDRLQGRSLTGVKNPEGPADPILVHPDVRRMLLESRALVEGGRALLLWVALFGDLAHHSPDAAEKQKANDYLALLTPIVKAYLTDRGFKVTVDSMQVHGGSGFTEHFPASQFLRDCRISMIYEGANGVQALDLVGRKLPANGGRAVMTFFAEIDGYVAATQDPRVATFITGLAEAKGRLQEATMWLMQNGLTNPDNAGAASMDYLHLFGLTATAYLWAQMAVKALEAKDGGSTDPYYDAKLATGRVFLERILPDTASHLAKLKSGAEGLMTFPVEVM